MTYSKIVLKSHHDERIQKGHLWVFSNEIARIEESASGGSLVDLYSHNGQFLGKGFFNPHSLISARILTRENETIDSAFFSRKIEKAYKNRTLLYPGENSYRLVFGESDFLPGLVIDRYENCFVVQSYCLGMDILMPLVLEGLKENFKVQCIVKKNDHATRALEKLKEEVEVVCGQLNSPVQISQPLTGSQPIRFLVDILEGQKTGFFFDQKENRQQLTHYCRGKRVLDCFSYTGGFGLYAAKSGADEVTSVDSSQSACQLLEKNFKLNDAASSVVQGDSFEVLQRYQIENRKFDIIVLDPPALAKSKKNKFSALRKYQKLNSLAMSLLNQDGILFSSSCSHHISRTDFVEMLNDAAQSQKKQIQLLEMRGQARDHPILPSMPETEYLKCAIVRIY